MANVMIAIFGILLPAVTLIVELRTGMCADAFFNPIPTLGHVLLVAFVPLANLLGLIGVIRRSMRWQTPLIWANAIAMGIALVYTLVFLPITPIACMAILFMGMGLLPLAPLASLICAFGLRYRLVHMETANEPSAQDTKALPMRPQRIAFWAGGAIGVLLLLAMEASVAITLFGAEMAASDAPEREVQAIRLLRQFGNKDELLRMCYRDGSASFFGPRGGARSMSCYLFEGVPRDTAQRIFFRVTGVPYNALPPPPGVSRFGIDDFDFDPDLGGEAVAGRRKGLSLASSQIDAKLLPDAALANMEWTLVFKNEHRQQREARAQILLPPGGVVSRVTLWVNGEPRDAAFSGVGEVRAAYKKVAIEQRRDPLLVTWAGSDRVLVQCFPVPPHGEMKIRLGIIAPLAIGAETAALRLPCFAERNFNVTSRTIHSLWCDSSQPYQHIPKALKREENADGKHVIRGALADADLTSANATIVASRTPNASGAWARDPRDAKKHVVQTVIAKPSPIKGSIIVVVDGSAGMADYVDAVAAALASPPAGVKPKILVAGDNVIDLSNDARAAGGANTLAARLRSVAGVGGCDNVPALLQAFEQSEGGDAALVWIHAAQPMLLQPAGPLVHWLEHGSRVKLYDVPVADGPNRLIEQLGAAGCLYAVPRLGNLGDDLNRLLQQFAGREKRYQIERKLVEGAPPAKPESPPLLARLWAWNRVLELVQSGKPAAQKEAAKLAAAYQLVTPVSGAVVLESQQQYDEAKLHPADPEAFSGTPEPATWILMAVALPWLLWFGWRRRRQTRPCSSSPARSA